MSFCLADLRLALGIDLPGDPNLEFSHIQFDTRRELRGSLFVALPGNRTDGHRFVARALDGGAQMAVVNYPVPEADPARLIVAGNPLAAMARLATLLRRKLEPRAVIGITGSNGKTTTKDLVAAALVPLGRVRKSEASFNNEIGVPITIAELDPEVDYAVVELGAQEVGEITRYCRIADPTEAVITNIGHAHIGLFGSRANIAFGKGELGAWLRPQGHLVLNADDPFAEQLAARTRAQVRWISEQDESVDMHVRAQPAQGGLRFELSGRGGCAEVELPTISPRVGLACAAAAAIAECLGIHLHDAAAGMAAATFAPRRLQVISSKPHLVIDDSYNANYESGVAALEALGATAVEGRRAAVLGEMLELGRFAAQSHVNLGGHAADLDLLLTVGINARRIGRAAAAAGLAPQRWVHFEAAPGDVDAISVALDGMNTRLREWLQPGDAVLVKGSNALNLSLLAARIAEPATA